MGTSIHTTDGDWISTPIPYETVRNALDRYKRPYIEVTGYQGNNYLIQISHITCVEEKLPNDKEEKK